MIKHLFSNYIRSLLCCLFFSLTIVSAGTIGDISHQTKEDRAWAEIQQLHDRGWAERNTQNIGRSIKLFRKAAVKLDKYQENHIKDRYSISFLRYLSYLGYLLELGDRPNDAYKAYKLILDHPLINSSSAMYGKELISVVAQERLNVIERRLQQIKREADKSNINIRGGSKGDRSAGNTNIPAIREIRSKP